MSEFRLQALSRRSMIKSIGGLAISLPFARCLAQAQSASDTGPTKRVVFISSEMGCSSYWWRPQGGENNFNIDFDGSVLKALSPLRSKLLILNGVGNYACSDKYGGVENHESRSVTFTACVNSKPNDPNFARGPSVDRGIIEKLRENRPLYATIGGEVSGTGSEFYYTGPGSAISGVGTSTGIFDALFANVSSNLKNDGGQSLSQLDKLRKTLLDQQLAEAQILRNRIGKDAQVKIDEYLTTIREQLKALENISSVPVAIPERPTNPDYNKIVSLAGPYDRYTRDFDLVADGLILGVTQVACLRVFHEALENSALGRNIDSYQRDTGARTGQVNVTDYHQNIAHGGVIGDQFRSLDANIICRDILTTYTKFIARFLQRLDASREADGSTVLDNTLVVWTSQLGDQSSHLGGRLPYVLAGGLGQKMGTFRMGRFIDYTPGGINEIGQLFARDTKVASNLLLNSVQKTFGIERDYFGENFNPQKCMGYLPQAT